jgi:hypothetical protein
MKRAEVHPNLAAFVLGGLEAAEAAEIRHHLQSCPACQNELEELRKVNRALEAAPAPETPPAYLKAQILSRVRAEGLSPSSKKQPEEPSSPEELRRSSRASRFDRFKDLRIIVPSVAAAAVVAMIALGVFFGLSREETPVATIQLIPTAKEAAGLKGYWGVAEIRPQPSGNQQVELKLNNFEEPKPNGYYELWFVSGEKRISAGSFITEEHVGKGPAHSREVALEGDMP